MDDHLVSEKHVTARKTHNCMACEWLVNDDWWRNCGELSISELREIVKAKQNDWNIVKGQKYLNQTVVCDGDIGTFKAIPEIHEICKKHDVYPN